MCYNINNQFNQKSFVSKMGKTDKQIITRSQVVFNHGRTMKSSKTNHVMN